MENGAVSHHARSNGGAASSAPSRLHNLEATIASGDALDVRRFAIHEAMSALFEIRVVALSDNPDIDFEAVVGKEMTFTIRGHQHRTWTGICNHLQQLVVEERGLSTYELTLVPTFWLLTQRRNHRMFQQMSEIDIAMKLLGEWGIAASLEVSEDHKKRKYRVQHGETDAAFLRRMLEEAGVSLHVDAGGGGLVLGDGPHGNTARPPIPFRDQPTAADVEHVRNVRFGRRLQPGKYTVRDHDYRRPPGNQPSASASAPSEVEAQLEHFQYSPGAFLVESDKGDSTPFADARGKFRTDEAVGRAIAARRLEAGRGPARTVTFDTNALDLAPGSVVSFLDHPKSDLAADRRFLVIESTLEGTESGEWSHACTAVSAEVPYRPPLVTPRPIAGVESATVVGPAGEEIHVDEFGRVAVHFHWDRESAMDDKSSCWIHVSQPWGGSGFGGSNLPRVGQEVIVDFLGGDPDRPIITGRVYTNLQKTPYKLPENKTQSGWKTASTRGTGGYNELMFEDAGGRELVRMQAERDLTKLVKHDEQAAVGRNRARKVGNDEAAEVGHDRARKVGNDESVEVGRDRARRVGNDETVDVGRDRARKVGNDEAVEIGRDRRRKVGNDETVEVGNHRKRSVGGDEHVTIAKSRTRSVGDDESVHVGGDRARTVGGDEHVTISRSRKKTVKHSETVSIGKDLLKQVAMSEREMTGLNRSVVVGVNRSTQVGAIDSTMVGETHVVLIAPKGELLGGAPTSWRMTKQLIELDTGAGAKITLDGNKITISAEDITIIGSKKAKLSSADEAVVMGMKKVIVSSGEEISVKAPKNIVVESTGGDVQILGGPTVKLNTR